MDETPELRRLAIAVVKKAVTDLTDKDSLLALDAALWLSGRDSPFWFDALDMPFVDGLAFLTSGRARKLNKRSFENGK